MSLIENLGRHVKAGALEELTLTTNGSQLARYATELVDHGVRHINVSVDTLDEQKFRAITRWGDLAKVKDGIAAAQKAGLAIKINAVALKGVNDDEIPQMIRWAHGEGMDLTLIETMPLGDIDGDRTEQYLPLSVLRARLMDQFTFADIPYKTRGRRVMSRSRRPADGSASSPRSPIISARAATGCASPAPARSSCASARRTPPICARPCVLPTTIASSTRRSTKRSRASPREMTSSSTAATTSRPCRAI